MATDVRKLNEIIDRRLGQGAYEGYGRLQKIESRIESISEVRDKVQNLDGLVKEINGQIASQNGEYYKLFADDPERQAALKALSCKPALDKLGKTIDELSKLKNRFSRRALRIAFIGRERQGKSTFIKTITGLQDKVIPAYSGDSCTGAVSVIHNAQGPLKVEVEYFTEPEFLAIVNDKLKKFFPGKSMSIGSLPYLKSLTLPPTIDIPDSSLISEYMKFKKSYVDHFDDYYQLIGQGRISYEDENEIAQHVAQYEEFPQEVPGSEKEVKNDGSTVWRCSYYKYVAVKSVDIYTPFQVADNQKIELVDTIGIGSAADTQAIEEEMFRVLREDCDAAVNIFRPGKTADYPDEQTNLLNSLRANLPDRDPDKWIVYVVNRASHGDFKNDASVDSVMPRITAILNGYKEKCPVAWAHDVIGDNLQDISDKLINPLLALIGQNLDELDDNLTKQAADLSQSAYNECVALLKATNEITSSDTSGDALTLFDEKLFPDLEKDFNRAMNDLDEGGYAIHKEDPYELIEAEYANIIDNIDTHVPTEESIYEMIQTSALLPADTLFNNLAEQWRNDIFSDFEKVTAGIMDDLQEKVKADVTNALYTQGLLGRLPIKDGPSATWLQNLIVQYVDQQTYPNLYEAFMYILNYRISIEGYVEYKVAHSLNIIDRTSSEFIPYGGERPEDFKERAEQVWQELINRILHIQNSMKMWIDDFSKIPNHSAYSRVHKFHVRVATDEDGKKEFKRLYRKNRGLIWSSELQNASNAEKAYGRWTTCTKELQNVTIIENFRMN